MGGMDFRVELSPWRWALRWPREVASARGGLASTRVGVSRGMEERKPERMAKRKVDVCGGGAETSVSAKGECSVGDVADDGDGCGGEADQGWGGMVVARRSKS